MKKILVLTLLPLVLLLVACGGTTPEVDAPQTSADTPEIELAPELVLIMGTVKLDESEHAIDSAQAAELLPLWKALRSLSESETASSLEVDALITQIQDTMTAEQMEAIAAMQLSMEDFAEVRATLGIEDSGFGGGNGMDPELRATAQAARENGEEPPEGFGGGGGQGMGGGGGGGGGGEVDPAARETAIAERGGTRGVSLALNADLLNAIIAFLEAK